jgi:hypothetical protein
MPEEQTRQRAAAPTWDDVVVELAERLAASSLRGPLQLAVDIYFAGPPDTAGCASITDDYPDTAELLFTLNAAITKRIGGPETSIVRQVARRWRGTPQRVEIRLTQLGDPSTLPTSPREPPRERLQIAQTV